jgi:hypothetical protein
LFCRYCIAFCIQCRGGDFGTVNLNRQQYRLKVGAWPILLNISSSIN